MTTFKKLFLLLSFFLVLTPPEANAATLRKRYVDTNSSAGGNGTTNSTSGGNRAYATLQEGLDAEATDLVSADVYIEFEVSGTAADGCVDISGTFVSDATRYLSIYSASGSRHTGTYNTGKHRIECSGDNALVIRTAYARIIGLQIKNTQSNPSRGIVLASQANGAVYIEGNIIVGPAGVGPDAMGIRSYTSNSGVRLRVSNNIIYNFYEGIYWVTGDGDDQAIYAYNNTIADIGDSCIFLSAYGTNDITKLRDNILQDCAGNDYSIDGTFTTLTTAKNLTEDATSPDGGTYQSKAVVFNNQASDDYHLGASDTYAKDAGDTLSADGDYPITLDIDGTTRSGSWDIGADEYVDGGGGGSSPVVSALIANGEL